MEKKAMCIGALYLKKSLTNAHLQNKLWLNLNVLQAIVEALEWRPTPTPLDLMTDSNPTKVSDEELLVQSYDCDCLFTSRGAI